LPRTLLLAEEISKSIGAQGVDSCTTVSKVSIVGLGMRTHTGVADRMFRTLAEKGINIHMITTSEIKISVLVDRAQAAEALQAVHAEFQLDAPLPEYVASPRYKMKDDDGRFEVSEERLRLIARDLPAMEDILVSGVDGVENQGLVTLHGVPDKPGVAARIFERVAQAGVAVDLIVQNVGADGATHLSFTVRQADLAKAVETAKGVMAEIGGGDVTSDADIMLIAVRGVGMRTHTGVAVKMFAALASRNVNIQLISTSELHITVVVDRKSGGDAAVALREAFHLAAN
jgi:aspartate kinase